LGLRRLLGEEQWEGGEEGVFGFFDLSMLVGFGRQRARGTYSLKGGKAWVFVVLLLPFRYMF
jgi:hypothetical protein